MSFTGPTPMFAENDKFDGTNWASWQRLIHLATDQRGAMEYLEGSMKQPIKTRNTNTTSKLTILPTPTPPTKTPWSFISLSHEE